MGPMTLNMKLVKAVNEKAELHRCLLSRQVFVDIHQLLKRPLLVLEKGPSE